MAIEGPIQELAPSDLLQLLFLSRRTGVLYARNEAVEREVMLEVHGGWLTGATRNTPGTRLGRLLVASGTSTERGIAHALGLQRSSPERRLGEILVEERVVHASEVERHLRFQVEEAVFDLVRWQEGMLRFEEGSNRARSPVEIRMSTDIVLMEAMRRLDEWTEVTSLAGSPDPVPRLAAQRPGKGAPLSLMPRDWEVLAGVDGRTSLQGIALGLGLSEVEVARAIYALASAGVVEVGPHAPARDAGAESGIEDAIASADSALAAGDLAGAEAAIRMLEQAHPGVAAIHVLRGRLLAAREEWAEAIAACESAIVLDPLLPAAYFHLAVAAAQSGDLVTADQALSTYHRLPDESAERRRSAERMAAGLRQLVGALEEAGR